MFAILFASIIFFGQPVMTFNQRLLRLIDETLIVCLFGVPFGRHVKATYRRRRWWPWHANAHLDYYAVTQPWWSVWVTVLWASGWAIAAIWFAGWGPGIGRRVIAVGAQWSNVYMWSGFATIVLIHFVAQPTMFLISRFINAVFRPIAREGIHETSNRFRALNPAVTGLVERILFIPLAILLLNPAQENTAAFVALVGGYVGVRTVRREWSSGKLAQPTSIHAIWNMSINLAFSGVAGWLFWRVPIY